MNWKLPMALAGLCLAFNGSVLAASTLPALNVDKTRISVSGLYVARNEAGRAVDELAGKPLLIPRPRQPKVDVIYIAWHSRQVFKGAARNEATDANP